MVYLIDFENVHEEGFNTLGRLGEKDAVYCFFTRNVAKISMSALAGIRSGQLHFIEVESGKQSLDMVLVSFLGYLIGNGSPELYYEIVSNDNGFQKVAEFWNKRGTGLRVRLRKTNEQKIKPEAEKTQQTVRPQSSRGNGRRNQLQQNSQAFSLAQVQAAIQASDSEAVEQAETAAEDRKAEFPTIKPEEKPEQKNETKPEPDKMITTQLENAGISASAAEFLQLQADKYKNDKNIKQLVYRAVVKKYGQKTGTQIYNSAKKLLLK